MVFLARCFSSVTFEKEHLKMQRATESHVLGTREVLPVFYSVLSSTGF